jgi:hypothetical protein
LFFSLFNPIISYNVFAEEPEDLPPYEPPEDENLGIFGKILKFFGSNLAPVVAPNLKPFLVSVGAEPAVVELGYGETVNLDIGMIDVETGDFEILAEDEPLLYRSRLVNFEIVEYPSGLSKDSWYIKFEPNTVDVKRGVPVKSNMSISLTSPPVASNAVQSGVFKIKVIDTWAMGNLWWPPDNFPGYESFFMKLLWLFSAIFILRFGPYSGQIDVQSFDVEILVKVKPYHAINLEALPLINFKPDEIASVPISVQNLGNYNDTINFRIISEHEDIVISDPVSVTLAPGETKDTYIGVSVPPSILDYGTIHNIKIQAYSVNEPNSTIAEREVILETKGVYFSEEYFVGGLSLLVIIVLVVAIFIYKRPKIVKNKLAKKKSKIISKKKKPKKSDKKSRRGKK